MSRAKSKQEKDKKRYNDFKRRAIEHRLLLDFSLKDILNGEVCHTVYTEPIVYEKINGVFGDNNSFICETVEYGQVLNRFTYWGRQG